VSKKKERAAEAEKQAAACPRVARRRSDAQEKADKIQKEKARGSSQGQAPS
jgi:hypothetical protein